MARVTEQLILNVTEDERAGWSARAAASGLSVGDYIRRVMGSWEDQSQLLRDTGEAADRITQKSIQLGEAVVALAAQQQAHFRQ